MKAGSPKLIEVDARVKVDDIRELLENVQYALTRGRYKVYLVDEVHMLSTHSFNALLKTLEEPPPHVTCSPPPIRRSAVTVVRCLQLTQAPAGDLISEHMARVLGGRKISLSRRRSLVAAMPTAAARRVVAAGSADRFRRRRGRRGRVAC
jgi:hypothetical protein